MIHDTLEPIMPLSTTKTGSQRARVTLISLLLAAAVLVVFLTPRVRLQGELNDFFMLTFSIIIESFPFIILGALISVTVQQWVPLSWFMRILPHSAWGRRLVISLLGVLLPVCECGNVPLSRGLIKKGLSVSESVTFLIAAPILNPLTIIATVQAFGWNWTILVARFAGGFLIANLIGWFVEHRLDEKNLLTTSFIEYCKTDAGTTSNRGFRSFVTGVQHELTVLLPSLMVGATIAGVIQVGVPRGTLVGVGSGLILSVIVMLLLAVVVSMCSNVDAFFALSFAGVFSTGSLVTFLLASPLIDIKMISLMRTTFAKPVIVSIVLLVALISVGVGLGINLAA